MINISCSLIIKFEQGKLEHSFNYPLGLTLMKGGKNKND